MRIKWFPVCGGLGASSRALITLQTNNAEQWTKAQTAAAFEMDN